MSIFNINDPTDLKLFRAIRALDSILETAKPNSSRLAPDEHELLKEALGNLRELRIDRNARRRNEFNKKEDAKNAKAKWLGGPEPGGSK